MDRQLATHIRQLTTTLNTALQRAETMWDSSQAQRDFLAECRRVGEELISLAQQAGGPAPPAP